MYKYLIDSAGNGLNGLALLALLTFFAILCIAFAAAFLKRRSLLDHMAALPLEDGAPADAALPGAALPGAALPGALLPGAAALKSADRE